MVLLQKFGESILSICGVTRIAKSDGTVHRCVGPDRADCPRLLADSPRGPGSHTCV
jgi:hypothetical protein